MARGREQAAFGAVGLDELMLHVAPHGGITDRANDEQSRRGRDGAQADLDRELAAVLVQTGKSEAGTHRSRFRPR